jgi:glycosyltransferase involved in cell wall biosynthesis
MFGVFLNNNALDIVIPVYNEGDGIVATLLSLKRDLKCSYRILICYDFEEDSTLSAIKNANLGDMNIDFVPNKNSGAHGAVITGFKASKADYILVFPADDDYNAKMLNTMLELGQSGADIVCASRFMSGGCMVNCPLLKQILVRSAAASLFWLGRIPTHDPTNGFRLFSRRVIEDILIESTTGFTYSLELLAKCHRLGWNIKETPAAWHERTSGKSQFQVLNWIPAYLRWYFYIFSTTWLKRSPKTVTLRR